MALNKRKVLEAARKYAQKGAQAKALKEYNQLLKADPRDARLRLEVGDAHRRWGNNEQAIETYIKVADQYMKEGFDARAVAVYKQIHNLDREAYHTYLPLAELYQRMGLNSDAIGALQVAADGYHKQGKKTEALDLLRKMAMLDPTNTASRIKVADLLKQESLLTEAVAEYQAAAVELERQGDGDTAVSVYERILEIEPDRFDTLAKLSQNLIDRRIPDRAEPFVKRILAAKPDEPDHYELMAAVYRLQQRDEELADTYRNLAALYRRRGDEDQAREILQRYVPSGEFEDDLGLDENTAFGALGTEVPLIQAEDEEEDQNESTLSAIDGSGDFDELVLDVEVPSDSDELLLLDDEPEVSFDIDGDDDLALEIDSPSEAVEVRAEAPAPTAPPVDPNQDPEQLLAEASVYLRYGKREQAISNLEAILAQDSGHRLALEKLGEAHAESDRAQKAVEYWLRAAEIARAASDVGGFSVLRDRIAALDEAAAAGLVPLDSGDEPESPGAASKGNTEATVIDMDSINLDAVEAEPDDGLGEEQDLSASASDEGDHEIDLDDIEIDIDDSEFADSLDIDSDDARDIGLSDADAAEVEQAGEGSGAQGAGASSSMVQQIGEDLEEADFYMNQGLADEAEAIYKRVLSIAPNHPHALVRLGEVAAMRGEDPSAAHEIANSNSATSDVAADDPHESSYREDIGGPDALGLDLDTDLAAGQSHDPENPEPIETAAPNPAVGAVTEPEGVAAFEDSATDLGAGAADELEDSISFDDDGTISLAGGATGSNDAGADEGFDIDVEIDDEMFAADDSQDVAVQAAAEDGLAEPEPGVAAGSGEAPEFEFSVDASEDAPALDAGEGIAADSPGDALPQAEGSSGLADETDLDLDALEQTLRDTDDLEAQVSDDEPDEAAQPIASPDDSGAVATLAEEDLGEPPDLSVGQASDDDSFDLAAELSDVFDDDGDSVAMSGMSRSGDGFDAVFREFKKGVSNALSEDDHEAHFDLGIAYREMGLCEDAKSEFRAAMLHVESEIQCRHMLGLCCFELGQFEEAIAEFEAIGSNEDATDEEKLSARFEVGRAYREIGEIERARTAWEAVATIDSAFCGVAEMLTELDRPKAEPPASLPEMFEAEELESFDDLMSDDDDDVHADASDPPTDEYESFSDFLSDENGDGGDDQGNLADGSAPIGDFAEAAGQAPPVEYEDDEIAHLVDAGADAEAAAEFPVDVEPGLDAVLQTEPEPEPEPDSEPEPKKKRRKISFV